MIMDRSKKTSANGQRPAPEGQGVGSGFLIAIGLMVIAVGILLFIRRPSPPPAAVLPTVVGADPAPAASKVGKPGSLAAKPAAPAAPNADESPKSLTERWGVEVLGVRLTMADTMADVRYKLLDADKAKQLADGKTQAFVIDQPSGARLKVPTPPAEGAFPPSGNTLIPGKTYFALVSNRGHVLKRGTRVTVVIGESQVTDVAVD